MKRSVHEDKKLTVKQDVANYALRDYKLHNTKTRGYAVRRFYIVSRAT